MNRNLYAIILVIMAIGLYFTVIKDVLAEADVIRASNNEYITAIKNAQSLIEVRNKVLDDYNRLSPEDRDKLDKFVPKSIDNIRLIIDLNNVALRYGFALKGIQASASGETPNNSFMPPTDPNAVSAPVLDTVTVSFGVSAPYQQFISFLQDLEASLRILDISSLSVTANDSGVYDWKIELKTYWLRN
jgi:Tfp pilus assembly protein PilO